VIESGKAAVAAGATDVDDRDRGEAHDLVIMDDFIIYGEPQAISAIANARTLARRRREMAWE
jgi:cob(I)alamin adenosyltransferase